MLAPRLGASMGSNDGRMQHAGHLTVAVHAMPSALLQPEGLQLLMSVIRTQVRRHHGVLCGVRVCGS